MNWMPQRATVWADKMVGIAVGLVAAVLARPGRRDERGLSQSTENAILLAGAVAVAILVITAVTAYVKIRLP